MKQSRHSFRSEQCSNRSSSRSAFQASVLRSKQHIARAGRVLGPALLALSFATVAHAQGTMDFSGATTLMGTFNTRFAYVSVSRASNDARVYTNDAAALGQRLSHDASKSSAVDFRLLAQPAEQRGKHMDNNAQHGFAPDSSSREATRERIYSPAEHERHYAPLNRELHADDARQFGWVAENGTLQSYQHSGTHLHVHIDGSSGQFYDGQKNPITQQVALDRAMGAGNHHAVESFKVQEVVQHQRVDQGVGLGL